MEKFTIREIETGDNAILEQVIRACLIEIGQDHDGTIWTDPMLGKLSEEYSGEGVHYWVVENGSGKISGGVGIGKIAGNDDGSPTIGGVHNMVIPAGVPALIYVRSATTVDNVPVEIATADDCKLTTDEKNYLLNGALTYQYLTQELPDAEVGSDNTVFVFGQSGGKVGFLRNTNKDYTNTVNNHFVLHNKLYYIGDYGNSVSGAKVVCEVVNPLVKGEKVIVFKMKRRKDSRKKNGHRQQYTQVEVKSVIA